MTIACWPEHLFLVGCGNMAGQMLTRWLACGLDPARVTVLRPSGKPVAQGVTVVTAYPDALPAGTTVLLGMKPYQIADVAAGLAPLLTAETRLVSILAGTPIADLRRHFPAPRDVVCAMPNLPVGLGEGVVALYTDAATDAAAKADITALIAPLGLAEWMGDEALFNQVTALSGCGPAFLFRFIDALSRAGEALGIPADQAARMALVTVQGSANMAARASVSPATLADQVASPGGMTRQGLNVLDADNRLLDLLTGPLAAAREKHIVITHGTDTMTETAKLLQDIPGKTVVLVGALAPARFGESDASFNLGMAFATAQVAEPGVYITMSGSVFRADKVVKDRAKGAFVPTGE